MRSELRQGGGAVWTPISMKNFVTMMNLWRGTFSMTRPDLKIFDLLRENVFLMLPVHLYMVFLVNCETATNPMGVGNITDVRWKGSSWTYRWTSPVQPSLVSANSGISIKQLCTRGPLGPGPRSLDPMLVTDYKRLKNTLFWNAQLEFSFSSICTRLHGELPSCLHAPASWHE